MSITASIEEAQSRLRQLLSEDEVIIADDGNPVARLLPIKPMHKKRTPGSAAGEFVVPDNFDDPLRDEIVDAFYK
jgi:antitoxin (DNA-binding transcriptional repressor) of toxin-antitoxin stability system